jgi:hypothetical protein
VWLYIYNGDLPFTEPDSLTFKRYAPPEPINPPNPTPITPGDFINRPLGATPAQSRAAWQQISISWKVLPGAAEVGSPVGVAFWMADDAGVDDASLTAVDFLADLNNDLAINSADWVIQRNNMHTDLSAFTLAEKYAHGDLTGDGLNNYDDFLAFANSYDAANGAGAFQALTGVPEPAAGALAAAAGALGLRRRRSS